MRVCAKQRQRSSTVRPELNRQPWGIWAGSIRHRITKADFRNAPAPPTVRFAAVPVFGFDRVENELRYCNMKRGQMSHVGQKRKSSMRAYVFRFAPNNGHHQARTPCLKSAGAMNGWSAATR
jgi:hypothetical protein